jgi:GNAT superfamily N-acetyltransferase
MELRMEYTADYFLNEIYDLEASGMLSDLALSPSLFTFFIAFEEKDREKATAYIISVLDECYRAGHLRIAISHNDKELYGYAMLFVHPDPKFSKYLHKIYVKEEFRGHGIGGQILMSLSKNEPKICLLCASEKVTFYEKHGFHYMQPFEVPKDENFHLSEKLYSGLCVMNNHSEMLDAPIFLLNDRDIKKIVGI